MAKTARKIPRTQADPVNISERLMIVRLSVSQWYARRFDRNASDDVAKLHGKKNADEIGRFNKILVELDSIKPIKRACADLKMKHYSMTAPWTDDGERVLTSELYFPYIEMVREKQAEIRTLSRDFARGEYATQIDIAKERLGSLFNKADYPSAGDIEDAFMVRYRFEPLPNPEDVRVWGVGVNAAKEIEEQVRADVTAAITAAQQHVADSVTKRAQEFVEKIARFHQGDTKMLFETAVENLRETVGLVLKGLNVTGDPALTKACDELLGAIAEVTVDKLRTGADLRVKKMAEVEKIASRFAGIYGGGK